MKAKTGRRPLCLFCDKVLACDTSVIFPKPGSSFDDLTPEEIARTRGIDPDRITKVWRDHDGRVSMVGYWNGSFGVRGCNRFCTLEHAYLYATRMARPPIRWQDQS